MFTQPIATPPSGHSHPITTTTTTTISAASRPSRLRGFSYHLRNYTHNHLLSRDSNGSTTITRQAGATSPSEQPSNNLTRSVSYTPQAQTGTSPPSSNRLTLFNSNPDNTTTSRTVPRSATTGDLGAITAVTETLENLELGTPDADSSADNMRNRASTGGAAAESNNQDDSTPTIRFSAYYDPRATRPSLTFSPITRSFPNGSTAIRVGRYSERDTQSGAMTGNVHAAAPVGFKSKVVSRKHCEFWCENGKWFIKDAKSSSGTFLNHIRLSAPSQESKAFPIADGDIIQLGIDFKGGEEMIFRCVKMRVELNRGWQNKLNTFNIATHKRLRTLANKASSPAASSNSSQDCSICLNSIAPCQSLFVAPCSHTWHFKCVRQLLNTPHYPVFICPNCRAGHDLEADVDDPESVEDWEEVEEPKVLQDEGEMTKGPGEEEGMVVEEEEEEANSSSNEPDSRGEDVSESDPVDVVTTSEDEDPMDVTVAVNPIDKMPPPAGIPRSVTAPLPISSPVSGSGRLHPDRENGTPSPPSGVEGPITPRNDAGPWVFDGSAGRPGETTGTGMSNLDAAIEMDTKISAPATEGMPGQ